MGSIGSLEMAVLRLLHGSWGDIDFKYDGLTPSEQRCLDRDQHARLVDLMVRTGLIKGPSGSERIDPEGNAPIEVFPFVTKMHREVIIRHLDGSSEDIELSPDEGDVLAGMIARASAQARSMEIE